MIKLNRQWLTGVSGFLLLLGVSFFSLSLGAVIIPVTHLVDALGNIFSNKSFISLNLVESIILWHNHFPRVIVAIISGSVLAVSGLLIQAVTKNDLACPSLLGISQGVALTDVILLLFFPAISGVSYFCFSLVGGLITASLIVLLAFSRSFSQSKLILSGIAINTLFYALSHLLILLFPEKAQSLLFNLNGSLMSVTKETYQILLVSLLFPVIFILLLLPKLKLFALSDALQKSLGENVIALKSIVLVIAVWLNVAVVSLIGPIFLFGLVVPQALRLMGVYDLKKRFILSLIFGALLMVIADSIIRYFYSDNEIPIGIIIGIIAAPLFIFLIRVNKKES
ncbi:iron ABC transporter permease [Thiotrichales bacterium 19S3-7]|nr:iron ABC transporter permease [Thiotrichales bacterium 19S3-7]MCF6802181.1 iron ABC transporter permease [Thiotrichales bacterium 19S3-11]